MVGWWALVLVLAHWVARGAAVGPSPAMEHYTAHIARLGGRLGGLGCHEQSIITRAQKLAAGTVLRARVSSSVTSWWVADRSPSAGSSSVTRARSSVAHAMPMTSAASAAGAGGGGGGPRQLRLRRKKPSASQCTLPSALLSAPSGAAERLARTQTCARRGAPSSVLARAAAVPRPPETLARERHDQMTSP